MISESDKKNIQVMNPQAKVTTINPGLDIINSKRQPIHPQEILFVGTMDWLPNEDAVLWFATKVFPLIQKVIKEVKFVIVGNKPTLKVQSLTSNENIIVNGRVKDLNKYYQKTSVIIVPLRFGSGIKIKIIEALLMKAPIVSTTIGMEGMELKNEKHILIADGEIEFSEAVIKLLNYPKYISEIVDNGYKIARRDYDPQKIAMQYVKLYGEIIRK